MTVLIIIAVGALWFSLLYADWQEGGRPWRVGEPPDDIPHSKYWKGEGHEN